MSAFDEIAEAMIAFDTSEGHIGVDAPVWGRYQGLTRVALEKLKKRFEGTSCEKALNSILEGK